MASQAQMLAMRPWVVPVAVAWPAVQREIRRGGGGPDATPSVVD
jgi:hypothetical protein